MIYHARAELFSPKCDSQLTTSIILMLPNFHSSKLF